MTGPVRVAVLGLGWAARHIWLQRLLRHPGYAVTAVVDPDPQARAAVQADAPAVRVLADVAHLDPAEVDLAVVAVPNHLHADIAARLLRQGLTVFVEKPVCLTSDEADALAAAERVGRGRLLAGSAARHRADVRALYEAAQEVGELRHVEASWVRARGVPGAGGWFTDRRRAGGGALLDLGWHLFDVLSPVLGDPVYQQVVGTTSEDFVAVGDGGATWRRDDAGGSGDVEDTARGFLVTDAGVSVALRASWASHEPLDVTRLVVEGSAARLELSCTFGFSPNRVGESSLHIVRDGRRQALPLAGEPVGAEYDRQLDQLLPILSDPSAQGRAVAEAQRTIGLIERLYESARRRPAVAAASR
ncbi:Gfo/Idh/MocA family protein [Catellatospora vulcania]|uniref:Gfo/Idh/MocA family protein n=1 Tax=Catellatospora vulcania TaxID=1460450 RepID=UPI0012D4AD0A|nr:Gfo/Idh/MocA family oxidoreductase [Catellatospora vulcania]